ncbi:hypothetical protein [Haloferula sp. BvORR071]|uniref:hypothetical protein n=1 Tax=Haloferula sp. BvORR071 TaxID=1396141 RepID=UPI002240ED7C|nr:hypothetical protein [Haloferula sp. BvORR071]
MDNASRSELLAILGSKLEGVTLRALLAGDARKSSGAIKPKAAAKPRAKVQQPADRLGAIRSLFKQALRPDLPERILCGAELGHAKRELGHAGSGRRLAASERAGTWGQWCRTVLGISEDTADNLIACHEACKARLADDGEAIALLSVRPSEATEEGRGRLLEILRDKLSGVSQARLLNGVRGKGRETERQVEGSGDSAAAFQRAEREIGRVLSDLRSELGAAD